MRSTNVMLPGMIGYHEDSPIYTYDPAKCNEELQASKWTKSGDTFTPDPAGDISCGTPASASPSPTTPATPPARQLAQILQTELGAINENFVVEVTGLPWPTFLKNQRASKLPIFFSGWLEDIHDPHNWVVPSPSAPTAAARSCLRRSRLSSRRSSDRAVAEIRSCQARRDLRRSSTSSYYDTGLRQSRCLYRHWPPLPAALGAGLVQQPDLSRHLLLSDVEAVDIA